MKLRIRNWHEYQHYKDRCPPWIKLHFRMLSSKDWVMLDDRSRVLAVACMLIASQSDNSDLDRGEFKADGEYIKRVAYLNHDPDFKPLIECGFLEVASGCNQMLADDTKCSPETETETETEAETEKPLGTSRGDAPKDDPDEYTPEFEHLWQVRPRRKGPDNKRKAYKAYRARLREGHTHEQMLGAVQAYGRWLKSEGKLKTEFAKMTATFLGPDKHFEDDWSEHKGSLQADMPASARWAQ